MERLIAKQAGPKHAVENLDHPRKYRTLVSEQHRRHHSLMKARAAAASARTTLAPFQKGQVWRMGDLNLAVTSVGKTLVHYKRYTTQPRGIQTTLTSKSDLRKYLMSGKAVLIAE